MTEQQTVFGARGHHAVRLVCAFGHKVVDQCADVGAVPRQNNGWFTFYIERGIHAGDKSLRGGFLIAGGTVELSRAV